jgi:hypothetical protein
MKNLSSTLAMAVISTLPFLSFSVSADPIINPAKGQTPEQKAQDISACQTWASEQIAPYTDSAKINSQTDSAGKALLKGGAGGAAGGAVIGAIAGDAGKGAAIGAIAGGVVKSAKNRKNKNEQQEASDRANADFNRAYSICLTNKGYTVQQ